MASEPYRMISLRLQDQRATALHTLTDPIEREKHCIPLGAFARTLEKQLPADARIFVSGVLGTNVTEKASMYTFLRNYLYPRELEISLDGNARLEGVIFEGVPCHSHNEALAKGFDYLIEVRSAHTVDVYPLNAEGGDQ